MTPATASESPFRAIGDLAVELGVKPHILRYWEEQFPMLQPLKRAGGRRHYRAEDVALLRRIHQLVVTEGYTIRGARAALQAERRPVRPAAPLAPPLAAKRSAVPAMLEDAALGVRLRALRDRLVAALADS